ncbi:MAG: hypothetical protein HQ449_01940 [Chitinophagaceae bacterium]|nr:hypothetical protein [Chitinophagaceae bacterium]
MGQDLTGKWKGYFTPSRDLDGRIVTYEIIIKENPDHTLTASTYSKISNNFTANALATGMHSENAQLVSITETSLNKKKLVGNFEACLMSNFLNYRVVRGYEILEGSYTAANELSGKDCGGGKVYLEKEGLIVKEFSAKSSVSKTATANKIVAKEKLAKNTSQQKENKTTPAKQTAITKKELIQTNQTNTSKLTNSTKPSTNSKSNTTTKLSSTTKSNTTTKSNITQVSPIQANTSTPIQTAAAPTSAENALQENTKAAAINETSASPNTSATKSSGQILPWVLVGRENKLVKQVIVNSPSISIDLYDNGTIDNDTIMVFDNKILLLENKRLSYKATHFDVNFNKDNNRHEIIIVAHNLGTVPPNTALMVVKDGTSRQEIYITSTLSVNAMIIFELKKPSQ